MKNLWWKWHQLPFHRIEPWGSKITDIFSSHEHRVAFSLIFTILSNLLSYWSSHSPSISTEAYVHCTELKLVDSWLSSSCLLLHLSCCLACQFPFIYAATHELLQLPLRYLLALQLFSGCYVLLVSENASLERSKSMGSLFKGVSHGQQNTSPCWLIPNSLLTVLSVCKIMWQVRMFYLQETKRNYVDEEKTRLCGVKLDLHCDERLQRSKMLTEGLFSRSSDTSYWCNYS